MARKSKNSLAASVAHQFPTSTPAPSPAPAQSPLLPILERLEAQYSLIDGSDDPIPKADLLRDLLDARAEIEHLESKVKSLDFDREDAEENLKTADKRIEELEEGQTEELREAEEAQTAFRRALFAESLSRPGTFELRMIDAGTDIDIRALDLIRSGKVDVETETGGGMEQGQCGPVTVIRLCPRVPTVLDGIKARRRVC